MPAEKVCPSCDGVFMAGPSSTAHSEDGRRVYCSVKCQRQRPKTGEDRICAHCSATFYVTPSGLKQGKGTCCSNECRAAYYVGARSKEFEGGYVSPDTGESMQYVGPREGYHAKYKYMAARRVAASEAIGRLVKRGEVVILINRQQGDHRPENLYLCESNVEFSRRRSGGLPWPTKSNLDTYR